VALNTIKQTTYIVLFFCISYLTAVNLFFRLCPYFNGLHHFEEIMFYEDLTRSQLLTLLDKFQDVLITCQYPDQATIFNVS